MTDLKDFYYNKWIEQVQENKKLKLEIERLNKISDYNSNFKEELLFLKREIKRYEKAIKNLKLRLKRYEK
jgi:hypothetical protein